jgi:hypothetical protein
MNSLYLDRYTPTIFILTLEAYEYYSRFQKGTRHYMLLCLRDANLMKPTHFMLDSLDNSYFNNGLLLARLGYKEALQPYDLSELPLR